MDSFHAVGAIAEVIQLAVAPVFLLTGVAGLLSVLSTRLHRIIDRAREMERRIPHTHDDERRRTLNREVRTLWRRIRLVNWSIRLAVTSALAVCVVVMALFIGDLASRNIELMIAVAFSGAMLLLIVSLLLMLYEVSVSTRQMRLGLELSMEETAGPRPPEEPGRPAD